jgi:hypothetical protein
MSRGGTLRLIRIAIWREVLTERLVPGEQSRPVMPMRRNEHAVGVAATTRALRR